MNTPKVNQKAYEHFQKGEYEQAAQLFELEAETNYTNLHSHWYLGLTYLLQGNEDAAQMIWLLVMDQDNDQNLEQQKMALSEVLETEAKRLESINRIQSAWSIRKHLNEIKPANIYNYLRFTELSLETSTDIKTVLFDGYLTKLLKGASLGTIDADLLLSFLLKILRHSGLESPIIEILKSAFPHISNTEILMDEIMLTAIKLRYEAEQRQLAADLAELCLILAPLNTEVMKHLSCLSTDAHRFTQGVEFAQKFYSSCDTPALKLLGDHILLRAFLNAGMHGAKLLDIKEQHEASLIELEAANPINLAHEYVVSLPCVNFFFYYLQDRPYQTRSWQNQVARIAQQNLRVCANQSTDIFQNRLKGTSIQLNKSRPLKVGYIAHTLKKHSVGWLSRWLFKHHDHDVVNVSIYLFSQGINNFTKHWFVNQADTGACHLCIPIKPLR